MRPPCIPLATLLLISHIRLLYFYSSGLIFHNYSPFIWFLFYFEQGLGQQSQEKALVPVQGLYVSQQQYVQSCKPLAFGSESIHSVLGQMGSAVCQDFVAWELILDILE